LDQFVTLAKSLNNNHKPNAKEFGVLANLLKDKHPQVFGAKKVTMCTGKEVSIGMGKFLGGIKRPADLDKRLDTRYYEVFRRGKVIADNAHVKAGGANGEPEKKRNRFQGGRPKKLDGVDTLKLDPLLTQLERKELTEILTGVESLSEADLSEVMKYDSVGALIQDEIYNHSFSAAKAMCPIFFNQPTFLRSLFCSICTDKDIFRETEVNLASEMGILDEYIFSKLRPEVYQTVADAKAQSDEEGSKATFFFALLKTLAEHWEEDFEQVFFFTDQEQVCRNVAVPHLVIQDRDYKNMSLWVDRTLILGQLSLSSGIPCLIAAHYMGNLCYNTAAPCLMNFLQQEICDLARLANRKGDGKKLKKLSIYQAQKNKIIVRMYRGTT
jgi:hypothetical protein